MGFPKTATTTIHAILGTHDAICVGSEKEAGLRWYWRNRDQFAHFTTDTEAYLNLFSPRDSHEYLLDATASYIMSRDSANAIHSFNKDAKIIIGLREPIRRLASWCFQFEKNQGVTRNFEQDLVNREPYTRVRYNVALESYIETFGRENVFVYIYEEFSEDPDGVMMSLCQWLGIDGSGLKTNQHKNVSRTQRPDPWSGLVERFIVRPKALIRIRARLREANPRLYDLVRERVRALLLDRVDYSRDLDEHLIHSLKRELVADVAATSRLLGRDLVSVWGYEDL